MCGIAGYCCSRSHHSARMASVEAMCEQIIHRGPDDQGVYVNEPVHLGMRRLSIIDLNTGHQPVFNEDGSVVVVFNGEIYNYRELRRQLEQKGHRFTTQTDTEVIVHAYEEYGLDFPSHFNGMFAIALWDNTQQRLILVRDRLGQKPLYYTFVDDTIIFGSELKCLLVHPEVSRQVDTQAVYNYFILGYIPQPRSIYRGVFKLPQANMLVYDGSNHSVVPYWNYPENVELLGNYTEARGQLRELLTDATRLRMISDVPIGAFLSGGIDSSITVAIMAQLSDRPIDTFFVDFDDDRHSERRYAQSVARKYGTRHHEFVMRPDATGILDELNHFFDEPFGDSSAIPTYHLSKLTRQYVTVALAGDAGDESFGGYRRYREILGRKEWSRVRPWLGHLGKRLHEWLPNSSPGRRFFRSLGLTNWQLFSSGLGELEAADYFSKEFLSQINCSVLSDLQDSVPTASSPIESKQDPLYPYSRFDTRWYLADDILTKVDRMSMAHSIELRSPFLDYRVVELAARMPVEWKINSSDTKVILKDAFRHALPDEVLEPRKHGFSIPLEDWFRNELRGELQEALHDKSMEASGLFSLAGLRRLAQEHFQGRRSRKALLWRYLVFNRWWHKFNSSTPSKERFPVGA